MSKASSAVPAFGTRDMPWVLSAPRQIRMSLYAVLSYESVMWT
jgi:hypothetical protein